MQPEPPQLVSYFSHGHTTRSRVTNGTQADHPAHICVILRLALAHHQSCSPALFPRSRAESLGSDSNEKVVAPVPVSERRCPHAQSCTGS